jgi:hypothetical protein
MRHQESLLSLELNFIGRGVAELLVGRQDATSGIAVVFCGPEIGVSMVGGAIRRPCSWFSSTIPCAE